MKYKMHRIEKGETLTGIIRHYYGGVDGRVIGNVMRANGLERADCIRAGDTLLLPGAWSGGAIVDAPMLRKLNLSEERISELVNQSRASDSPRQGGGQVVTQNMPDIRQKLLLPRDYWERKHKKDLIILHFTAGYTWRSAYETFRKPGRTATSFIVDVDGAVYQLFDPEFWSYHIGVAGRAGENFRHDKRSIGVEIVNIGPVWRRNGQWVDYVGKRYTGDSVVAGKNRDAHGGVKFPAQQVRAVCLLVRWLMGQFDIPPVIPADFTSFQLPAIARFKGVATHQMFRRDKYDLGPAFPFEELIRSCGLEKRG